MLYIFNESIKFDENKNEKLYYELYIGATNPR